MTDEKYRIIHVFHVGSVLQNPPSIQINVFKVYLHNNSYKKITKQPRQVMVGSQHNTTHLRWIMGQQQYATLQRTAASLRGHKQDIDFHEDKLRADRTITIADINCCVMTCS